MIKTFEDGWTDDPTQPDRRQIPDGFELTVGQIGDKCRFVDRPITGTVESKHLGCHRDNPDGILPDNECLGAKDALILDGIWTYKVQAVNMATATTLKTTFDGDGEIRVDVPVQVHYQPLDVYDRVPPLSSDDVTVALYLNGVLVDRMDLPPDRTWVTLSGVAEAPIVAELYMTNTWANSRDFWTDAWVSTIVDTPIDPPLNYKSIPILMPQDATLTEMTTIRTAEYANRRTMTQSHDEVIRLVNLGLDGSYAIIYDIDRWPHTNQAQLLAIPHELRTLATDGYSQRDPRWDDLVLGEDTGHSKTIGNWGCLMVAYNMQAVALGLTAETPDQFNQTCVTAGAFHAQYIQPAALRTVYPDQVQYDGFTTRGSVLNARVREYVAQGLPVPCRVDFKPSTGQWEQHWILVIGATNDDFIMLDPWTGLEGLVSSVYGIPGDDLLEGIFYQLRDTPPPIDPKIDVGSFMVADPYAWRVVRLDNGSQEDIRDMDLGNGLSVRAKGQNGEWWSRDTNYNYLVHDTSPANDSQGNARCYTVTQDGHYAPKNPNQMALNTQWTGQPHHVQFRAKSDCRDLSENSGQATNHAKLVRYETNYTFNSFGQNLTLDEVIWLDTGEMQIYAKHQGRVVGFVGWSAQWGSSEIVELHWDRGKLDTEPNRYCPF